MRMFSKLAFKLQAYRKINIDRSYSCVNQIEGTYPESIGIQEWERRIRGEDIFRRNKGRQDTLIKKLEDLKY